MPAMPVRQPLFLVLGTPRPELRVSEETGPETTHRYHTRECQMEELKQGSVEVSGKGSCCRVPWADPCILSCIHISSCPPQGQSCVSGGQTSSGFWSRLSLPLASVPLVEPPQGQGDTRQYFRSLADGAFSRDSISFCQAWLGPVSKQ